MTVTEVTKDHVFGKSPQNIGNDEFAIVLVHTDGCPACQDFYPEFVEVARELKISAKFYSANATKLDKIDMNIVKMLIKQAKNKGYDGGVPITLLYSNARLVEFKLGNIGANGLKEWLS